MVAVSSAATTRIMSWQDVLTVCVWSRPRKEWDELLIEPLLCQYKYKVNIDLSGVE